MKVDIDVASVDAANVNADRWTPEPRSGSFGGRPCSMKC